VDESLTVIKRLFREQGVYHICTAFKYRQKYTLGLHTADATQREAAAAASTHYCWFAA